MDMYMIWNYFLFIWAFHQPAKKQFFGRMPPQLLNYFFAGWRSYVSFYIEFIEMQTNLWRNPERNSLVLR